MQRDDALEVADVEDVDELDEVRGGFVDDGGGDEEEEEDRRVTFRAKLEETPPGRKLEPAERHRRVEEVEVVEEEEERVVRGSVLERVLDEERERVVEEEEEEDEEDEEAKLSEVESEEAVHEARRALPEVPRYLPDNYEVFDEWEQRGARGGVDEDARGRVNALLDSTSSGHLFRAVRRREGKGVAEAEGFFFCVLDRTVDEGEEILIYSYPHPSEYPAAERLAALKGVFGTMNAVGLAVAGQKMRVGVFKEDGDRLLAPQGSSASYTVKAVTQDLEKCSVVLCVPGVLADACAVACLQNLVSLLETVLGPLSRGHFVDAEHKTRELLAGSPVNIDYDESVREQLDPVLQRYFSVFFEDLIAADASQLVDTQLRLEQSGHMHTRRVLEALSRHGALSWFAPSPELGMLLAAQLLELETYGLGEDAVPALVLGTALFVHGHVVSSQLRASVLLRVARLCQFRTLLNRKKSDRLHMAQHTFYDGARALRLGIVSMAGTVLCIVLDAHNPEDDEMDPYMTGRGRTLLASLHDSLLVLRVEQEMVAARDLTANQLPFYETQVQEVPTQAPDAGDAAGVTMKSHRKSVKADRKQAVKLAKRTTKVHTTVVGAVPPLTTGPYNVLFHYMSFASLHAVLVGDVFGTETTDRLDARPALAQVRAEFARTCLQIHEMFAATKSLRARQLGLDRRAPTDDDTAVPADVVQRADSGRFKRDARKALAFAKKPIAGAAHHVAELSLKLETTITTLLPDKTRKANKARAKKNEKLAKEGKPLLKDVRVVEEVDIAYWVTGRLFPPATECYVCYHPSVPQHAVELAFALTFGFVPV